MRQKRALSKATGIPHLKISFVSLREKGMIGLTVVKKESLIKCFKIKKLIVNGNLIEDECLVGISDNNFNFGDVDLLLHNKIVKER